MSWFHLGLVFLQVGLRILDHRHLLPGLDLNTESVRPLEDNVCLEFVISLGQLGVDLVATQDVGQQDLQLQHSVFPAYAGTWASGD